MVPDDVSLISLNDDANSCRSSGSNNGFLAASSNILDPFLAVALSLFAKSF